jgi:chromosome segregation ATPase
VSSRENTPSPLWTYRMEVSPTGQASAAPVANVNDPIALLQVLVNLQSQSLEMQRQTLENQRQQLELAREASQIAREQRARQIAELERWQTGHEGVIEHCRESLGKLEQVHSALMGELTDYVDENHENLLEGEFTLTDFVDRFGPRLAHLNTMLAVLRPLAAALKKPES